MEVMRYIDIYAPDLYGKSEDGISRFFQDENRNYKMKTDSQKH